MRLDHPIKGVQEAESDLGRRFRVIGERHAVEHDLYHLGHTLAGQCAEHLQELAPFAEQYGAPETGTDAQSPPLLETLRLKGAELLGHSEKAGLLLLRDLRHLYLTAQHAEISWIILIQCAQAVRDPRLLETATTCHAKTEMQGKWLRTRIKTTSPQLFVAR